MGRLRAKNLFADLGADKKLCGSSANQESDARSKLCKRCRREKEKQ
jgi:hypothetical protein